MIVAALFAFVVASFAIDAQPTPPPDAFVRRMHAHGTPVVAFGSFVGVTWPCAPARSDDDETCRAGIAWADDGVTFVTGT